MSKKTNRILAFTSIALVIVAAGLAEAMTSEQQLGKFLFFDANLSNPPGQSCGSCHHPKAAYTDPDNTIPVSEGVISGRFGTLNTPSAAYAAFSPDIYFDEGEGLWIGGQFWNGRAANLVEQAKGPFLNSLEMNNTKEGVISAIRDSYYAGLFKRVYGADSLNNVETAYDLVAEAIAAYEETAVFNKFTSKYDYYLKGKAKLTDQELRGLQLFEAEDKGNCAACHPSQVVDGELPLMTDFSYDNLGIPKNLEIDELKKETVPVDYGLGAVKGAEENGKFKVSSLRNVGITAPYGHNGYFKTLKEIVHFYNTRDVDDSWPLPEVSENVNTDELGNLGLTSQEEDDIVAFLKTLTDGFRP